MASERVTFRLDALTRRRLESFAAARALTPSDVVREALASHLPAESDEPSCYDLARTHGLVGAARNTPADLSTNRKHLQGFGR